MSNAIVSKQRDQLRFPAFESGPTWRAVKLGDVLTEHKLKSDGTSQVHSVSVHKGLVNQIEHLGRSFAAADTTRYNLVKPFDIVYTKSPTGDFPYGVVKQSRLACNAIVSPLYGVFTPQNIHLGQIIDAFFESPDRACRYLEPLVKKGPKNTMQISNEVFLSREIWLPISEEEQEKVAHWITVQNQMIAAHTMRLELLREFRRGMMQKVFLGYNTGVK